LYVCGQICSKIEKCVGNFVKMYKSFEFLALPPSPPFVTTYVRYFILCIFSESRYLRVARATPRLSPPTHLSPSTSTTHSPLLPQQQALQHLSPSTSTTLPRLPQQQSALQLLSLPPPLLQHHHQRQQGGEVGFLLILLTCMQ